MSKLTTDSKDYKPPTRVDLKFKEIMKQFGKKYDNEEEYVGSIRNKQRHGFGLQRYLDGSHYEGNW